MSHVFHNSTAPEIKVGQVVPPWLGCMKKKFFTLFITALLLGCAPVSPLKSGTDLLGKPVCLTDCQEIPGAIEKFKVTHDLLTEEDEIDYLFYRIRSSPNKFIRNGTEADSMAAAEFLRRKIRWYERRFGEKITTDEDFVSKVMKGSTATGKPYEIILPGGTKHNAQYVMQNELNFLKTRSIDKHPGPKS